jgi:two-component system, OmpR family, response regulator
MLVLSRRLGQNLVFPSIQTTVQIVSVKGGIVRLGIDAPDYVTVFREEVLERNAFQAESIAAPMMPASTAKELMHLLNNRLNASAVGLALLRRQLEQGLTDEMAQTLDRIEGNLRTVQDRVERLEIQRPAAPAKRRALLVEDDRNECELLAGLLRMAGLDVHTAGDGADALDYLNFEGKPDVMLLDMIMPRCDGPTTVRTIRRNPSYAGLRIFGLTGATVDQFGLAEGPSGIDRWFRKPINPEVLLKELMQNLDIQKATT